MTFYYESTKQLNYKIFFMHLTPCYITSIFNRWNCHARLLMKQIIKYLCAKKKKKIVIKVYNESATTHSYTRKKNVT